MANVEFNEPSYTVRAAAPAAGGSSSSFSRLVIKFGLAKDEKGAQMVLLGIAVIAIVLAVFVLIGSHHSAPAPIPVEPGAMPGAMP
jgi:hypothetical protein